MTRARGGMKGMFKALTQRYKLLGGTFKTSATVTQMTGCRRAGPGYSVITSAGEFFGSQVVSTLPIWNTAQIAPPEVNRALEKILSVLAKIISGGRAVVAHAGLIAAVADAVN